MTRLPRSEGSTSAGHGELVRAVLPAALPVLAQLVLVVLYARAIGGLAGSFALGATLAVAALVGHLVARTRLRGWVIVAGGAVAAVAVRWALVNAVALLAASSVSPGIAAVLQRLDAASLAALPVAAMGYLGAIVFVRRPSLARWEPALHGALLLVLLWSQAHYDLTYFERPWAYVVVVGSLVLLDALLLVGPDRLSRRVVARVAVLVAPVFAIAILLSVFWYTTGGTAAGGGILRPTLFRFDFAPFVRLESEISMSDDLVLLYRRSGRPRRDLIRRFVLSDYDPRRGFSVANGDPLDAGADVRDRELVEQEYFLVNLDPQTRLALNEPIGYVPFETWDQSSFTAAFAAESMVSRAPAFRLARVDDVSLDPAATQRLTDYGGNEAIRELALEVAGDEVGPFARARAIELYFHENFFYSLRPGIAADGDQLTHFLFEAQKGYCSYFAFSMTLMLRSLGIPARVAVGFFVDPGQEVLNFYPVLANMAHAWVEVYLGEYGWVTFDPTSQTLAPGEEYDVGAGADPDELASLLEEILAQELVPASPMVPDEEVDEPYRLPAFVEGALARWYLLLPLLYLLLLGAVRLLPLATLALTADPRRRTVVRMRSLLGSLGRCGIRRRQGESLLEFGRRVDVSGSARAMAAYERALFAERFTREDEREAADAARQVREGIRRAVPLWRRSLAALDPRPAGVARRASREEGKPS